MRSATSLQQPDRRPLAVPEVMEATVEQLVGEVLVQMETEQTVVLAVQARVRM
jgi:hypothetical protein